MGTAFVDAIAVLGSSWFYSELRQVQLLGLQKVRCAECVFRRVDTPSNQLLPCRPTGIKFPCRWALVIVHEAPQLFAYLYTGGEAVVKT